MPEPGQRAHRRIGETIRDKYRLDAFIAAGSMANVYAATHRNGSRVALKILHRELARDPQMAERFRREGYFANAIGHPGVVRAIDDDVTDDGCAFIVLELLEGETLEERRMRLGGKVPLAEILQIGDSVLDVLAAAHGNEVLHRDVKPENVFITNKGEVKLLDFGHARFNDGRASSDMTSVGMVMGTPAFMPPEAALGKREEVDIRSDIWGVGATLFTCIAGEAVHVGGDPKTKSIMTARSPARPLRDVAGSVPRAVASVIDRALAFDKVERWNDANAMREALRWARMSLNESRPSFPDGSSSLTPAPVTKRGDDEEPTLALRSPIDLFDETTAPKNQKTAMGMPAFPPAPGPLLSIAPDRHLDSKPSTKDDVYTSAPPVTERGEEAAPASDDDPTLGLDRDWPPDSSHTELPQTPRVEDPQSSVSAPPTSQPSAAPAPPITQRLPGSPEMPRISPRLDSATAERPMAMTIERPMLQQPDTVSVPDAGALFRAALARAEVNTDDMPLPRFDATLAMSPDAALGNAKTMLGMGSAAPAFAEAEIATSHPPPGYPVHQRQQHGYGAAPPPYSSAPAHGYASAAPQGQPDELRQRNAQTGPGPLLSTIAPKKQSTLKKNAILAIAAVVTLGGTYAFVAGSSEEKKTNTKPAVSVTAASAAASSAPAASASPPMASAPPTGTPAVSVAAAASAPPKKRRRPRPPAIATAVPLSTETTATATATATPPVTTAMPVPDDSLPKKEDPE